MIKTLLPAGRTMTGLWLGTLQWTMGESHDVFVTSCVLCQGFAVTVNSVSKRDG